MWYLETSEELMVDLEMFTVIEDVYAHSMHVEKKNNLKTVKREKELPNLWTGNKNWIISLIFKYTMT